MPIRPVLDKLIYFVRELCGEAAPASSGDGSCSCASDLSDASIQRALDETRERVRYVPIQAEYTRVAGGAVEYHDYEADGYFDNATVLMGSDYVPFSGADFSEFDALHGRFSFVQSQRPVLYLSGNRYDPYRAAASVLVKMAASVKGDVDFKDANTSLSASQASKAMITLASEYRKMACVHTIEFGRSDT